MHVQRSARLALASVMLFGMAASAAVAQDSLRIGAINPYSGPLALYGDELARGYQLAVAERTPKAACSARRSSWCAATRPTRSRASPRSTSS